MKGRLKDLILLRMEKSKSKIKTELLKSGMMALLDLQESKPEGKD